MFSAFGRKTATIPAQGNMAVILKGGALFFCQKTAIIPPQRNMAVILKGAALKFCHKDRLYFISAKNGGLYDAGLRRRFMESGPMPLGPEPAAPPRLS